jgi:hypothetical protein
MDNLLTGQDDPEKRVAELERQLAERKHGGAPPPARPHDAATARRFVATAARGHRFVGPLGLAVDPNGSNVYVTDHTGYRAPGGGSWFGIWHPKDDAEGFVLKLPAA